MAELLTGVDNLPPLTLDRRDELPEGSYQAFAIDFGEFGFQRYPSKIVRQRSAKQNADRVRRYRYAIGYTRSYTVEALGLQPAAPLLGQEILWAGKFRPGDYAVLRNPSKWAFSENHAAVLGEERAYKLRFRSGIVLSDTPPAGQTRMRPISSVTLRLHRAVPPGLVFDWLLYILPAGRRVESIELRDGRRVYLNPQRNTVPITSRPIINRPTPRIIGITPRDLI